MRLLGSRWWLGAILLVAVAALALQAWTLLGRAAEGPRIAGEVLFVDVTNGDLFSFDVSGRRAVVVPERNPSTGAATLLGVEQRPDGRWYIRERHLPQLAHVAGSPGAVLDRRTGEVRVSGAPVRRGT